MIYIIVSRQQQLDEALLEMIVNNVQPLSLEENEGFVNLFDSEDTIPMRTALKAMIERKVHQKRRQ